MYEKYIIGLCTPDPTAKEQQKRYKAVVLKCIRKS